MDTVLHALIQCSQEELNCYEPFFKAAEFGKYESTVHIHCLTTGQRLVVRCDGDDPNCWGWRYFQTAWVRRYGQIHP